MSAAPKVSPVAEMTKWRPKEPKDELRLQIVRSLSNDLQLIARVRSKVNKEVGDGTQVSPTQMAIEELEELVDEQFKEWGGKPVDQHAEDALIAELCKTFVPPAEDGPSSSTKNPKKK